jgi:hypothetical protein
MNSVTAGDAVSLTIDVGANGEQHTAFITDAAGREMSATATVGGSSVTVGVSESEWRNGESGFGFLQIRRGGSTVHRERIRIFAGLKASQHLSNTDYGSC